YGLFGSPTPDHPGVSEILIGVLLVAAAGMGSLRRLNPMLGDQSVFLRSLHVLFFVGLIAPVTTGVLRGNDSLLMARDILAFLFLCLPLFMVDVFARHETAKKLLPCILVFAGMAFAVRTLMP